MTAHPGSPTVSGVQVRELTRADAEAARQLGQEAFGVQGGLLPLEEGWPAPGDHVVGAFDDDRLVGKVVGRDFSSHFAGARVPTWGIAGVTVAGEARGRGVLRAMLPVSLAAGRAAGAVISTLFPTSPGIYRSAGFELVGAYVEREIASGALAGLQVPHGITLHRATLQDIPQVRALHATWGAAQHGPLTRLRDSVPPDDEGYLTYGDGLTLARDADGTLVGSLEWERGVGYDEAATFTANELIAVTPAAAQALWAFAGSFSAVTGRVRSAGAPDDVSLLALPAGAWRETRRSPYMLAVLDVAAAFAARRLRGPADLAFTVTGLADPGQDGGYRVTVTEDGSVRCERADATPGRRYTARGLAVHWAGVQSSANLRFAGLLDGDEADDAAWDALLGGRQFHVHDYF